MPQKIKRKSNLLTPKSHSLKRVVVAMSGGVDSSVAAALLKESGDFQVIGVFMKLWSEEKTRGNIKSSSSTAAEKRAKKIAKFLKIPFYTFNFEKEFKKKVVDCFLNEFEEGVTPNPCIICNKEIKFKLLFEKGFQLEADFMATGHYVRIREKEGKISLVRGKDKNKDQSYFLWKLSQEQLKNVMFPVGGYTKPEVRKLAKDLKLPIASFPQSQEICFVPEKINHFLEKYLKTKPGKIVEHQAGRKIGQHKGLWFYTIGQRKGIRLPKGPFYVVGKDLKRNNLVVSKDENDLYKKEIMLKSINWLSSTKPRFPLKVKTKVRYRHKMALSVISQRKKGRYKLQFKKAQRAITPGQSAVFYKRDQLLGGGIIC